MSGEGNIWCNRWQKNECSDDCICALFATVWERGNFWLGVLVETGKNVSAILPHLLATVSRNLLKKKRKKRKTWWILKWKQLSFSRSHYCSWRSLIDTFSSATEIKWKRFITNMQGLIHHIQLVVHISVTWFFDCSMIHLPSFFLTIP